MKLYMAVVLVHHVVCRFTNEVALSDDEVREFSLISHLFHPIHFFHLFLAGVSTKHSLVHFFVFFPLLQDQNTEFTMLSSLAMLPSSQIHYDHQVLLDYLISKDTGASSAEYLLRYVLVITLHFIFLYTIWTWL